MALRIINPLKQMARYILPGMFVAITVLNCASITRIGPVPEDYEKFTSDGRIYKKYEKASRLEYYKPDVQFYQAKYAVPASVYVSADPVKKWCRLVLEYTGPEWISFDQVEFTGDKDKRIIFEINSARKETRKNEDNTVYESINFVMSDNQRNNLRDVLSGAKINLELSGRSTKKFELDKNNVASMLTMIELYEKL